MSDVSEEVRDKEAAFNVYGYIFLNFLYDMVQGEKTDFMEKPMYKALLKEYVKADLEFREVQHEKDLHG